MTFVVRQRIILVIFVDKNCGAAFRIVHFDVVSFYNNIRFQDTLWLFLCFIFSVAFGDDSNLIVDITPDQVRGVGESVNFTCTLDESTKILPFWLKRNRNRLTDPSDPTVMSVGNIIALNDPAQRFTISQVGPTYTLSVSYARRLQPAMQLQFERNKWTIKIFYIFPDKKHWVGWQWYLRMPIAYNAIA